MSNPSTVKFAETKLYKGKNFSIQLVILKV